MGGSSSKQAPPWVGRATIANASSPLPVLSQLRLENVIACIDKYRAQAQTARALDAGSLEDLCDDFVSDCRHFAKNDFRRQLIALYTATPSQAASASSPGFQTGLAGFGGSVSPSTGGSASASRATDATPPPPQFGVRWKEDTATIDVGEERGAWVHVDCHEVFASLIVIASGPLEAKVEYLAKLFCWTGQQEIEAPAVYLLLVAVVRGVSLLTQNVPPSDILLAEVLERVDACGECTGSCTSLVFEHVRKDKALGGILQRDVERSLAAERSESLSEPVQETLKKCASKVWTLPSVVAALVADAFVQEYHEVITKVFLKGQIEERLSEIVQNFRRSLQRVTNPASFQSGETADLETKGYPGKRSFSAGRPSVLKKKGHAVEVVEFDLVPLPWKHIDAILGSCLPTEAVNASLLDELQFETRAACQELGIEWKKWLDEPIPDTLNEDNLAELLPHGRKEPEPSASPQRRSIGHHENQRRDSSAQAILQASAGSCPQAAQPSAYRPRPSSATSRALSRVREGHAAGHLPRIPSQRMRLSVVEGATHAGVGASTDAGTERTATKEPVDDLGPAAVKTDHSKFAFSSESYMWSDDVQLIVTPLLAFCAIDCHGDGVIAARHLDLLFHLLKIADPVQGGFFSKLEKILAADTRALFSLSVDALDPFIQLRKILCKQRQEIRLLSFAVAISICATIQDRRQHENSLASKFKRFDLEQSGTISRSDLEVLLVELLRNTVNIEDSSAGYDKALQVTVEKTINTIVDSGADRVEMRVYLQAHDRIKKDARKLKAEILEAATQFEAGYSMSRQNSWLKRMNSQKSRRSSSMLRGSSYSGLRRGSKMRSSSSSKNAIIEHNFKGLLGKK